MRAQSVATTNGGPQPRAEGGELSVVVGCHGFVCAIGVQWVARLVLPDEVVAAGGGDHGRLVEVAGDSYAAWDLGDLFGLAPLASAWVLLAVPYEGGRLPIALRTGPCLVVQKVRPELSLPVAAFRARGRAFLGAFDAAAVVADKLDVGTFGVVIDPSRLLTATELASSAALLSEAAASRAVR
jgi:hypothetical protein